MSRWKEFRREPVAGEWTRKQKRGYHRVRSLLWFWECHKFQVLWVTLSTAEGGNAEKLTYHLSIIVWNSPLQVSSEIHPSSGYEARPVPQAR
ncbi:MAG: hypothetical protein OJF50_000004 [Nitrospira sp.]|jgi:hypothetical protein|nr:hypothetical protein [Nitrospira sp.]